METLVEIVQIQSKQHYTFMLIQVLVLEFVLDWIKFYFNRYIYNIYHSCKGYNCEYEETENV